MEWREEFPPPRVDGVVVVAVLETLTDASSLYIHVTRGKQMAGRERLKKGCQVEF